MTSKRAVLSVFLLSLLQRYTVRGLSPSPAVLMPDVEVASRSPNAFRIFNAVHSAMRQWGSSVQHNGMSIMPVTIPEGNLFYHGGHDTEISSTLEWLAFEMEHADLFAQNYEFDRDPRMSTSLHGKVSLLESQGPAALYKAKRFPPDNQHSLAEPADGDRDNRPPRMRPDLPPGARGYLQTYRAARPLNLLYLDGQAAATCRLGTLDTQETIMLGWDVGDGFHGNLSSDWDIAIGLCKQAKEWDVDGILRMEAGFEIIYCNFSAGAGLELVNVHGSPWRSETHNSAGEEEGGEWRVTGIHEWLRAAAERYHGFPAGRAEVDFSGMVSAFAYDVNTTNPDPKRPELPRLMNTTAEERRGIKSRVREVLLARKGKASSSINWQGVVDSIVTRYATRLLYLTDNETSIRTLRSELATLLYPFLDFPSDVGLSNITAPLSRCAEHHLSPITHLVSTFTPEDHAIHAAIRSVSHAICSGLFVMRRDAHSSDRSDRGERAAGEKVRGLAQELRDGLDWTAWKECGKCGGADQMCFVPMFPIGAEEDLFRPRCKRKEEVGFGYFWKADWRNPRGPW
ncbi:hypothetical protein GE09DRAFT_1069218 [Coniochaeta sp. 2T2.1]|nr:hypothetical protein GE09DRAFT_1069218 [Coniochaeta sp. 2T2.1]